MKTFGLILCLTSLTAPGMNQELSASIQEGGRTDKTEIIIGENLLRINENEESVNVRIGNRGIRILETLEKPGIKIEKYTLSQDWDQDNLEERRKNRRNRFRGHWTGVEFGFNNYSTSRENLSIPDEINFMTLHSGKSRNFNLNFSQLSLGLTRHFGFVTGLGLNWNNYKFDGNNNIIKGTNGIIEELDPGSNLEKSKLTTLYVTLPFLLELNLPVNSKHINFAAGPIGAVKIGSHSKMVFQNGQKVKSNSDYNLNLLRYGGTARVGFANFQIYGTCYMTPLFRSGKSPGGYDLYPFEIGMAFTFND